MSTYQRLILLAIASLLSSCGIMQATSVEDMSDSDRLTLLKSKSNEELCRAYNNSFLKQKTENQIASLLRDRGVNRCDALSKIRLIPDHSAEPKIGQAGLIAPNQRATLNDREIQQGPRPTPGIENSLAAERVEHSLAFGNNADLKALIDKMRAEPLTKGPLESQMEFLERRSKLVSDYKVSQAFKVTLNIANKGNRRDHLVYYDPDSGDIKIVMPSTSRALVFLDVAGKRELRWLHNSFVTTEVIESQLDTYAARNRLGASIKVIKSHQTAYGIAILNPASKDYSKDTRQAFSKAISKEEARQILESGKLVLEVIMDVRYPTSNEQPFLLKDEDKVTPTFDTPLDVTRVRFSIPVRLLAVEVIDNKGEVIFRGNGTSINSNSITD